jgi:rhodanese-related sulfurtransferase
MFFMEALSPDELKRWLDADKEFMLLDVREPWEHEHFNIGGILISLGDLMTQAATLPKDKPVVIYCEKGIRSVIAIQRLQGLGFTNLYNLSGGMKAWRDRLNH